MQHVRALLLTLRYRPALVAWGMFVAMLPFYVGRSGLPQPGNALLFITLPLALSGWNQRMDSKLLRVVRALGWFALWVTIVNYGWVLVTGKLTLSDYAIVPFFYIFNTIVMLVAFILMSRYGDRFLRATLYAVLFSLGFQVLASFFYRTDLYRSELFFNNPNQLGYWSLLAGCVIALAQKRLGLGLMKASAALVGCAYLGVMSASRAAVAGIAILLVLLVFTNPRVIIVAILASIALISLGGPVYEAINKSSLRAMQNRDPGTTFLEERGYMRMWTHKEYILVGAGEGDLMRFTDDPKKANEIHSSFGTVVFSYGIIGTFLFCLFFWRLIDGAQPRVVMLLVPVLLYAVAHQGLRFTMFWIALAMFGAIKTRAGPPPS